MTKGREINFNLPSADDLFSTQEERDEAKREMIMEICIEEICDFPNHPFKIRMDEEMANLVESVKQYGVLSPVIVRPKEDDSYEMIAGHRRRYASELAEKTEIPCIVRNLSDAASSIVGITIRVAESDAKSLVRRTYGRVKAHLDGIEIVFKAMAAGKSATIVANPSTGSVGCRANVTEAFANIVHQNAVDRKRSGCNQFQGRLHQRIRVTNFRTGDDRSVFIEFCRNGSGYHAFAHIKLGACGAGLDADAFGECIDIAVEFVIETRGSAHCQRGAVRERSD